MRLIGEKYGQGVFCIKKTKLADYGQRYSFKLLIPSSDFIAKGHKLITREAKDEDSLLQRIGADKIGIKSPA